MIQRKSLLFYLALATSAGACGPRVAPLKGSPEPSRTLPRLGVTGQHRRIVFRWDYEEQSLLTHGEGAIRVSSPDSARVDLFLVGGIAAGYAILIGDSLSGPNINQIRRVLPPPAMLWATVGRLAVPALPDTVIAVDGDTIRAEIGRPAAWRVTIRGNRLTQLARLSGGRIAEVVTRDESGRLFYEVPGRRKLWLGIVRDEEVPAFDASIWNR
jgi:hypothetical protein